MISIPEFRELCKIESADKIVEDVLLTGQALHVSDDNKKFLRDSIGAKFGIPGSQISLYIVGSAKLGFSLTEGWKYGRRLERYRLYSGESDIDVAIVCHDLFTKIWDGLAVYAHGNPWMPWNSQKLGDYLVYGWLRPDHFPMGVVTACNDWWDEFRRFSAHYRFGRRRVRGGLFHSVADLQRYQRRAVIDCINFELSN
jgi:hypothetical protein